MLKLKGYQKIQAAKCNIYIIIFKIETAILEVKDICGLPVVFGDKRGLPVVTLWKFYVFSGFL